MSAGGAPTGAPPIAITRAPSASRKGRKGIVAALVLVGGVALAFASRARAEGAVPDDVRADLEAAEASLGRGETREARRLAQHSLLGKRTSRAFSILTRAACRDGDLANARAGLRNVRGGDRASVLAACATAGLDLR